MGKFKCFWMPLFVIRFVLTGSAVSNLARKGYFVGTFWKEVRGKVWVEPSASCANRLAHFTNWEEIEVMDHGKRRSAHCLVLPLKFCAVHSTKPFDEWMARQEKVRAAKEKAARALKLKELQPPRQRPKKSKKKAHNWTYQV